jgi:hypothetical protein
MRFLKQAATGHQQLRDDRASRAMIAQLTCSKKIFSAGVT